MKQENNTTGFRNAGLLLLLIFLLTLLIDQVEAQGIQSDEMLEHTIRCQQTMKKKSLKPVMKCRLIKVNGCSEMLVHCKVKAYVHYYYDPDMEVDKYVERKK